LLQVGLDIIKYPNCSNTDSVAAFKKKFVLQIHSYCSTKCLYPQCNNLHKKFLKKFAAKEVSPSPTYGLYYVK